MSDERSWYWVSFTNTLKCEIDSFAVQVADGEAYLDNQTAPNIIVMMMGPYESEKEAEGGWDDLCRVGAEYGFDLDKEGIHP